MTSLGLLGWDAIPRTIRIIFGFAFLTEFRLSNPVPAERQREAREAPPQHQQVENVNLSIVVHIRHYTLALTQG